LKNILKHKRTKADLASLIVAGIIIFVIGMVAVIGVIIWTEVSAELKVTPEIRENNNSIEAIEAIDVYASPMLDLFVAVVFLGFLLFLIISSAVIDASPLLIGGFIFGILILIFLAAQFAEVFNAFTTDSLIASYMASMPMTNFLLGKAFPSLIGVTAFIVMLVLFGKPRSGGTIT
jgi:hypothetical protein